MAALAFAGALAVCAAPLPCSADMLESTEARYLAGLRERQLFRLVDGYCRRKLDEAYTSPRRRGELTIELSRNAIEAALYARSPERETLFVQATKVIDDEIRRGSDDHWRPALDLQRALVELVWGERLREEAQTLASGDVRLEEAREKLRSAALQLKRTGEVVAERLRDANRKPGDVAAPDLPTAAEWSALKRQIDYQLARAYRNQGESYPSQSPDRLSTIEQAVEALKLLSRSEAADAITWQARLDEAHCWRLLGDLNSSEKVLDLIDSQAPPPEIADRARALRIRNRVAADNLAEAQKYFRPDDADPTGLVTPEVRLAELEWLVYSARQADAGGKKTDAADFQSRAVVMAKLIEDRHSPYWARRAESLLASSVAASSSSTSDTDVLAKAAESFFRQGNVEKTLELYDQMFVQAMSAKQSEGAFAAGFTAAAVEQQRGRHDAAALRYEKLAAVLPNHARAGEAHLLAAYNLGRGLTSLTDPAAIQAGLARYAQVLEDHVKLRRTDRTTAQARVWLAKVYLQRREFAAAVAVLRGVPVADPPATDAVELLSQAAVAELRRLQQTNSLTATQIDGLAQALLLFAGSEAAEATARRATLRAAALQLEFADDRFAAQAARLRNLLATTAAAAPEQNDVRLWLVLAEAGAGNLAGASEEAAKLTGVASPDAAAVVERLGQLTGRAPAADQSRWASLIVKVVDQLSPQRSQFPDWIERVAPAHARALATLGRTDEARRVWDELAAAQPTNLAVLEGYAEFLLTSTDRESLAAAIEKWRAVERASAESSPAWYRARLGMARGYAKLGDRARAKQIAELTQALHPDLGGPEMRERFLELLRKK